MDMVSWLERSTNERFISWKKRNMLIWQEEIRPNIFVRHLNRDIWEGRLSLQRFLATDMDMSLGKWILYVTWLRCMWKLGQDDVWSWSLGNDFPDTAFRYMYMHFFKFAELGYVNTWNRLLGIKKAVFDRAKIKWNHPKWWTSRHNSLFWNSLKTIYP